MILHKMQRMQSKPFATSLLFKVLTMFVVILISAIASTSLVHAQQAPKPTHYANGTSIEWDGDNIVGTCYTDARKGQLDSGGNQLFWVTMPDGQKLEGTCRDPNLGASRDGHYKFSATPQDEGYHVDVHSTHQTADGQPAHWNDKFQIYNFPKRPPFQRVGVDSWKPNIKAPVIAKSKIILKKVSANPDITDDNAAYSLAGAVFGVYRDQACTNEATTLTTDASGNAVSGELNAGQYWIKINLFLTLTYYLWKNFAFPRAIHDVAAMGNSSSAA